MLAGPSKSPARSQQQKTPQSPEEIKKFKEECRKMGAMASSTNPLIPYHPPPEHLRRDDDDTVDEEDFFPLPESTRKVSVRNTKSRLSTIALEGPRPLGRQNKVSIKAV